MLSILSLQMCLFQKTETDSWGWIVGELLPHSESWWW